MRYLFLTMKSLVQARSIIVLIPSNILCFKVKELCS